MVDVLSAANLLRVPVLIEYDELKKLQVNAATDALTGLHNRRLFDEYFDKELNRAKRYGQQLAVVILDLHKLKEVNDRHGHLQGDQVLQIAAATLRGTLRNSDFAFRIGGDEFAVLLPQTDSDQAVTLCRRVRSQYENELRPLALEIGVTLDFGVAVHPQDGDQKSALMGLADKRLYELKHSGRAPSRVVPLEPPAAREAAPVVRSQLLRLAFLILRLRRPGAPLRHRRLPPSFLRPCSTASIENGSACRLPEPRLTRSLPKAARSPPR